jgi:hypothetical protein
VRPRFLVLLQPGANFSAQSARCVSPQSVRRAKRAAWALGEGRSAVRAPASEQIVVGFDEAERAADELAEQLG